LNRDIAELYDPTRGSAPRCPEVFALGTPIESPLPHPPNPGDVTLLLGPNLQKLSECGESPIRAGAGNP
jgi:hypothetical protein